MMSSDDVPPPEGVAHAVAAHTSRITQVFSYFLSRFFVFFAPSLRAITDTSFLAVEISGSLGSSNAIYNKPMDRHRCLITRLHAKNPRRTRMVYRYVTGYY